MEVEDCLLVGGVVVVEEVYVVCFEFGVYDFGDLLGEYCCCYEIVCWDVE